jgi:vacuolar-type H+-ATPase subunit H
MGEPETLMDHFEQETHSGSGDFPHAGSPGEPTTQSVAEQLNSLLLSAEGTARRIVQEAEARARDQLAGAEQRIRSMEAESARLASWSQQTEQMIQALSSAVGEFRRDVEAIPQRISDALSPLASHVPVLVRQMEELMGALTAPTSNVVMGDSNAMVNEHSVEAGWGEGWNESGNGAA